MADPRASSCETVAGHRRSAEVAARRTDLEEQWPAPHRPGSASSATGRLRTPDRWPRPRAGGILMKPDAQRLPAPGPRCPPPTPLIDCGATLRTTHAIRVTRPGCTRRAPVDRAGDWVSRATR